MIGNTVKAIGNIKLDDVCRVIREDIVTRFGDHVENPRVRHSVRQGVLSIKIHYKGKDMDDFILDTMLDYVTSDVKSRKLIPFNFIRKRVLIDEKTEMTDIEIRMKPRKKS